MGFLSGAFTGALAGAAAGPVGAAIGFFAGGVMAQEQEDAANQTKKKAEEKAETARRNSIVKGMGAKQQADDIAMAGLNKNNARPASTPASQQAPGGLIGSTVTTAGTF